MRGHSPLCRRVAGAVCAVLAAGALAAALTWNSIFEAVFASQIALVPNSRAFRNWVAPTVPLLFDVYLFNWTNPDKFPEEKPILVELGPYRFREQRHHVNVTWHAHNQSLAYRTQRTWHFDDSSNGTLDDNITILNVIAASAAYQARGANFLSQKTLSMALAMFGHGVSVSRPARELLFEGYSDPLLDIAKALPESVRGGAPPIDKFGLFYGRNNSMDTDGDMLVTTGEREGSLPGQILRWNHLDRLPFYDGKCAVMAGSAGEFMPHNLTEDSLLEIFMGDLCRTVYFNYTATSDLQGLIYHKYALMENSFDYSPNSPQNSCFCKGACGWRGVMNVSACRYNAPAFLSLPHFLHGEPALRDAVHGLRPRAERHSFYFGVEPKLGVPVDVAARFQFNVYLEPTPNIALFENAPRMLFPVFWVQQKVTVDAKVVGELRAVRSLADWGALACAAVALALAAALALASCCPAAPFRPPVTLEAPRDDAELKLNPVPT